MSGRTSAAADAERPNDLPGTPDWKRTELALDEVPADALAHDLDGDGKPELVILTSAVEQGAAVQIDRNRRMEKDGKLGFAARRDLGQA